MVEAKKQANEKDIEARLDSDKDSYIQAWKSAIEKLKSESYLMDSRLAELNNHLESLSRAASKGFKDHVEEFKSTKQYDRKISEFENSLESLEATVREEWTRKCSEMASTELTTDIMRYRSDISAIPLPLDDQDLTKRVKSAEDLARAAFTAKIFCRDSPVGIKLLDSLNHEFRVIYQHITEKNVATFKEIVQSPLDDMSKVLASSALTYHLPSSFSKLAREAVAAYLKDTTKSANKEKDGRSRAPIVMSESLIHKAAEHYVSNDVKDLFNIVYANLIWDIFIGGLALMVGIFLVMSDTWSEKIVYGLCASVLAGVHFSPVAIYLRRVIAYSLNYPTNFGFAVAVSALILAASVLYRRRGPNEYLMSSHIPMSYHPKSPLLNKLTPVPHNNLNTSTASHFPTSARYSGYESKKKNTRQHSCRWNN